MSKTIRSWVNIDGPTPASLPVLGTLAAPYTTIAVRSIPTPHRRVLPAHSHRHRHRGKKKTPELSRGFLITLRPPSALAGRNVGRTGTLLAFSDFKVDRLAFVEGGIARGFDLRVVDKQVLAAVRRADEAESLVCVEPFYSTFCHVFFS